MDDVIFVRLTNGKVAMIDAIDASLILSDKWHAHKSAYNWYACRMVGRRGQRKFIYMHRVIMNVQAGRVVHHIDGNSLNNCRNNLAVCSQKENLAYRNWGK